MLVIGLVFGALQGVATAMIGIQAFIVTLAGLQIARGLARIWSGGQGVAISYGDGPDEAPESFSILGERTFDGLVPIPVLIFAVVAIAAVVFLRVSAFSRHLYAVGGNEKAARLSGVPVVRVKIAVFAHLRAARRRWPASCTPDSSTRAARTTGSATSSTRSPPW